MKQLRKKWESYGRIAGSITLKNTSEEERRAIGGIVGKTFSDETIKLTFKEFEQGLQKTRFAPIDMKLVLEHYFESSLYTNQEQRDRTRMAKREFFNRLEAALWRYRRLVISSCQFPQFLCPFNLLI